MTKDKYLQIREQLGREPLEEECPPDLEDFPITVQNALITYNKLGDRVYPDVGYIGKDFSTINLHMEILNEDNKELFLETLVRLDAIMIEKSAKELKKQRDKAMKKK